MRLRQLQFWIDLLRLHRHMGRVHRPGMRRGMSFGVEEHTRIQKRGYIQMGRAPRIHRQRRRRQCRRRFRRRRQHLEGERRMRQYEVSRLCCVHGPVPAHLLSASPRHYLSFHTLPDFLNVHEYFLNHCVGGSICGNTLLFAPLHSSFIFWTLVITAFTSDSCSSLCYLQNCVPRDRRTYTRTVCSSILILTYCFVYSS